MSEGQTFSVLIEEFCSIKIIYYIRAEDAVTEANTYFRHYILCISIISLFPPAHLRFFLQTYIAAARGGGEEAPREEF